MMKAVDESGTCGIEVILFDAAGTLFRTARSVGEVYAEVARDFSWKLEGAEVGRLFRSVWGAMPEPDWGRPEGEPERDWWRALVGRVLEEAGVKATAEEVDPYFGKLWHYYAGADAWVLYEEVVEVLEKLRAGYRLGVLSNFDDRLLPVLRGLGIDHFFEVVTFSSLARARKPDPAIFAHALSAHRIRPCQALHVGDEREADWGGARRAGMAWYELSRPRNDLRGIGVTRTSDRIFARNAEKD